MYMHEVVDSIQYKKNKQTRVCKQVHNQASVLEQNIREKNAQIR